MRVISEHTLIARKCLDQHLNDLKLKDLQTSACNNSEANIRMSHNGLKVLKSLLTSNHASVILKLDLHYVSTSVIKRYDCY